VSVSEPVVLGESETLMTPQDMMIMKTIEQKKRKNNVDERVREDEGESAVASIDALCGRQPSHLGIQECRRRSLKLTKKSVGHDSRRRSSRDQDLALLR
jgi:hypothetical protein